MSIFYTRAKPHLRESGALKKETLLRRTPSHGPEFEGHNVAGQANVVHYRAIRLQRDVEVACPCALGHADADLGAEAMRRCSR